MRIPAGTPVDYVARVDPTRLPDIVRNSVLLNLFSDEASTAGCSETIWRLTSCSITATRSASQLNDADKWALIEYLKTF